jgi:hypothetical protein
VTVFPLIDTCEVSLAAMVVVELSAVLTIFMFLSATASGVVLNVSVMFVVGATPVAPSVGVELLKLRVVIAAFFFIREVVAT